MIDQLVAPRGARFRAWLSTHVHFCSSLVDRITTGSPPPDARTGLQAQLGYADELLTVTEPYALWPAGGEPAALQGAFPRNGPPQAVASASDIGPYRDPSLRLRNRLPTALAP